MIDVLRVQALLFGVVFSVGAEFNDLANAFFSGVTTSVGSGVTVEAFAFLFLDHGQVCGLHALPGWEPYSMWLQAIHFLSAFQP